MTTEKTSRRLLAVALVITGLLVSGLAFADLDQSGSTPLTSMTLVEQANGTQLAIRASEPLVWHQYRDSQGRLVIDLPNSEIGDLVAPTGQGLISGLTVETVANDDRPMTRLLINTAPGTESEVEAVDEFLTVLILPRGDRAKTATIAQASSVERTNPPAVTVASRPRLEAAVGTADEPLFGPSPNGVEATRLQAVTIRRNGDPSVEIVGDGEFLYSSFILENPPRFVVDLHDVVNTSGLGVLPAGLPSLDAVRVAQFQSSPSPVSRVVLDLPVAAKPTIRSEGGRLVVRWNGEPGAAPTLAPAEPIRATTPIRTETQVAAQDAPRAASEQVATYDASTFEATVTPSRVADASPAPVPNYAPEEELWEEELVTAPSVAVSNQEYTLVETSDVALLEAAQTNDDMAGSSSDTSSQGAFAAREVTTSDSKYVGAPITFTLRDADIKEVLRTFAKIGGLNMVVQPGVEGSVTVELEQVPWDQALEQILKVNGLGYELEGNIMRIAPRSMLASEAQDEAKRLQALAESVPLKTVMKRISYSTAAEIASLLGNSSAPILSSRGSAAVDARTNTVIIKELPDYMDAVLAVIDQIDVPEPQVMIEARIVETTKEYSRSLGVAWGFLQSADAEHGNTTGLTFPNEVNSAGGVNLLTGGANGFLDVSLANILDTFSLDASLQAAEQEGLVNILSAPKIATLNNASASIQSGLQIPIQTVSNNTVSVQFVNATLKLDVTPHVTADGTVLMDINVQKREPQLAFVVQGSQNAPISTKEARTRVIVRDGGTTVIGGIYKVTNDRGQDRVPGLANIPILGHLFKNRRDSNQNDELLIFITPRVIKL
ncbi:MAG: type IV pilus secretin PilQ [Thermoanaerobaculia bacterium]|nr:type IV pilus secretin PilQ [Thermoanaerobaculia bacterium]